MFVGRLLWAQFFCLLLVLPFLFIARARRKKEDMKGKGRSHWGERSWKTYEMEVTARPTLAQVSLPISMSPTNVAVAPTSLSLVFY